MIGYYRCSTICVIFLSFYTFVAYEMHFICMQVELSLWVNACNTGYFVNSSWCGKYPYSVVKLAKLTEIRLSEVLLVGIELRVFNSMITAIFSDVMYGWNLLTDVAVWSLTVELEWRGCLWIIPYPRVISHVVLFTSLCLIVPRAVRKPQKTSCKIVEDISNKKPSYR